MPEQIPVRFDRLRGCGWRKPHGIYLVAAALARECGRFPAPVTACASCGRGIKPARGWTWIIPADVVQSVECRHGGGCLPACPMSPTGEVWDAKLCGLLWVGEGFYKNPGTFLGEAASQGVSRRIHRVPKNFKIGQTWVLLGHPKAIQVPCSECCTIERGLFGPMMTTPAPDCRTCHGTGWQGKPGIIAAFKPEALEYIVDGTETEEDLERLRERGLLPVRVLRQEDPREINARNSA